MKTVACACLFAVLRFSSSLCHLIMLSRFMITVVTAVTAVWIIVIAYNRGSAVTPITSAATIAAFIPVEGVPNLNIRSSNAPKNHFFQSSLIKLYPGPIFENCRKIIVVIINYYYNDCLNHSLNTSSQSGRLIKMMMMN
ncbi:unnamed protein product [Allacma fusca]|uniref:Uncharacterized protein n=1 Tax=Allacma fusca TaxID=39272 RepID=A0A8J2Q5N9_9HEXA|nr:unnamed protein product [Allacma fusca]